jgi:hypothetical protein
MILHWRAECGVSEAWVDVPLASLWVSASAADPASGS